MRFELCPVRMEELKQYKLDMQEAFQKGFENKYVHGKFSVPC